MEPIEAVNTLPELMHVGRVEMNVALNPSSVFCPSEMKTTFKIPYNDVIVLGIVLPLKGLPGT